MLQNLHRYYIKTTAKVNREFFVVFHVFMFYSPFGLSFSKRKSKRTAFSGYSISSNKSPVLAKRSRIFNKVKSSGLAPSSSSFHVRGAATVAKAVARGE